MNTVSGDVADPDRDERARSQLGLGRRRRRRGLRRPQVGTVSGDLLVRAAGPGDVGLKAVSGDVVVAMRRGLRVKLDINSVSGSVGSELDVSDTPIARRRAGGEPPRPHGQRRRPDHARSRGSRIAMRQPGGLWRHRDFMSLWGAETISQFGTQVSLLALPLVAIIVLERERVQGRAADERRVPAVPALHAAGGRLGRPARRRPILVLANVGRAVALLSVPIAHWVGVLTIWQLYVVGFVVRRLHRLLRRRLPVVPPGARRREQTRRGELEARDQPRGREHRRPGHGRRPRRGADGARRHARRRGQLRALGAAARRDPQAGGGRRRARRRRSLRTELGEGLRYVFKHSYQRTMVAMTALSNFFGQVVFSILLVYAVRELGLSAGTIGIAARGRQPGHTRGGADREADRRPARRRPDDPARLVPLRPGDAPDRIRAQDYALPRHRRRHDRDRLRRHPLQRHRDQPDPGDHARPDPRPRERLPPLRRLGRRPARRLHRRRARLHDRPARDDGRRRPRRPAHDRPDPLLAAPLRRTGCRSSSLSPPRSPRRAARQRSSARRGQAALAAAPARRSPPPTPPSRR